MVNRAYRLALAALVVAGTTACAKTPPAIPVVASLTIPTPPAHLVIPVELPPYVEPRPEPIVELAPPPEPEPSTTTSRATEKPAAPPPPPPASAPAPPILRTTNTPPSALEQRVRGLLASAEEQLKKVNFRELGATGRLHYGQARDFIRMANDNLRTRNYGYAEQLAVKANTVAGLLTRS